MKVKTIQSQPGQPIDVVRVHRSRHGGANRLAQLSDRDGQGRARAASWAASRRHELVEN